MYNVCANKAIRETNPRLSGAQALAMWKGFLQGAEASAVDWDGFYAMSEAVAVGDACASEFADMDTETFQLLGFSQADKGATRLQAKFRGNKARKRATEIAASQGNTVLVTLVY